MFNDLGSCLTAAFTSPAIQGHWPSANLSIREYASVARPFSSRSSDVAGFSVQDVALAFDPVVSVNGTFLVQPYGSSGLEWFENFSSEGELVGRSGGYQRVIAQASPNRLVWFEHGTLPWSRAASPMGKVTMNILSLSRQPLVDRDAPDGYSDAGQIAGISSAGRIWLDLRADHQINARHINMAPETFAWRAQQLMWDAVRATALREKAWRQRDDWLHRQAVQQYSKLVSTLRKVKA